MTESSTNTDDPALPAAGEIRILNSDAGYTFRAVCLELAEGQRYTAPDSEYDFRMQIGDAAVACLYDEETDVCDFRFFKYGDTITAVLIGNS